MWLNEGFATYAALLWQEGRDGHAAYRTEMNKLAQDELHGPIFMADVTDSKKLFGAVTFDKGAWVLHMLRHVMGDGILRRAARLCRGIQLSQRQHRGFSRDLRARPRQGPGVVLRAMDLWRFPAGLSGELDCRR